MKFSKHAITFFFVIGILGACAFWYWYPDYIISKHDKIENAGAYGDVFGAVTALFTALAFALLIYTALMQREELMLQRKELRMTRRELKKSAKAQDELVRLTKDANEFQKYIRKNEMRPELEIYEAGVFDRVDPDRSTSLKTRVDLVSPFVDYVLYSISFVEDCPLELVVDEDKQGSIIKYGEKIRFMVFIDSIAQISGKEIRIIISDVDKRFKYAQILKYDSGFKIFASTEINLLA